ncbi:hypothetical protein Hanom_Chr01g00017921 [Helianthus anomalus]
MLSEAKSTFSNGAAFLGGLRAHLGLLATASVNGIPKNLFPFTILEVLLASSSESITIALLKP